VSKGNNHLKLEDMKDLVKNLGEFNNWKGEYWIIFYAENSQTSKEIRYNSRNAY
jgi:hypothetical protein